MKNWGYILLFLLVGNVIFSQNDSTVGNPFHNTSIYKRVYDVYLGNYGQAKYSLLSPLEDNSIKQYEILPSNSDSLIYTDIFCLLGLGPEGVVEVNHHQPLSKTLYLNLNYFTTTSQGAYLRQKATQSQFVGNLDYKSKSEKYGFELNADFFNRNNQLNGGVDDSAFVALYNLNASQTLFPVNLPSADMVKKNNSIKFQHHFAFKDSIKDSSYFRVGQELLFNRYRFGYVDEQNDFYKQFNRDSVGSNDSLTQDNLTHRLKLTKQIKSWDISLGYDLTYAEYIADSIYDYTVMNGAYFGLGYQSKNLVFTSQNQYTFNGFFAGNISSTNNLVYQNADSSKLINHFESTLIAANEKPNFYYHNYFSNRNSWSRELLNTKKITLHAEAKNIKHGIWVNAKISSINNHVYFNQNMKPSQTNLNHFQVGVGKSFHFLKRVTWSPYFSYQTVSSSANITLPDAFVFSRLYVEGNLFKKVMRFHLGFDLTYYTDFTPKAYDPAFDQFYVQPINNNTKAGSYPYIDVFAEFYLKTYICIFIKSEHFNNDFFGPNHIASPTYRTPDRTIKAGVKWRLYN